MASTRSFGGVNEAVWECVKATSKEQHNTDYEPADANQGTSTTSTPVGSVVLGFNFDSSKETVTYSIQKKPFIVSADQIWNGIHETIEGCAK